MEGGRRATIPAAPAIFTPQRKAPPQSRPQQGRGQEGWRRRKRGGIERPHQGRQRGPRQRASRRSRRIPRYRGGGGSSGEGSVATGAARDPRPRRRQQQARGCRGGAKCGCATENGARGGRLAMAFVCCEHDTRDTSLYPPLSKQNTYVPTQGDIGGELRLEK